VLNLGLIAEMFHSKVLNQNVTIIVKNKQGSWREDIASLCSTSFYKNVEENDMRRCTVSKREVAD
jgi:superfamily I DNA and/or RNA helicase